MQKKYGDYNVEQLKELVNQLAPLVDAIDAVDKAIANMPEDKFNEVIGKEDFSDYHELYSIPLENLTYITFGSLFDFTILTDSNVLPDPQQALIDKLKSKVEPKEATLDETISDTVKILCYYALCRSFKSIQIHGVSIYNLLETASKNDDEKSLFNAIRIDRTLISNKLTQRYIAKAQLRRDIKFFTRLGGALKGSRQKHSEYLDRARLIFMLLRDGHAMHISENELHDLIVNELRIYANSPTAPKNIFTLFSKVKNLATI